MTSKTPAVKRTRSLVASPLFSLAILLCGSMPAAAAPPDLTAGGVPNEDPARTINLGPTGLRGWVYHVKSNTSEIAPITAAR